MNTATRCCADAPPRPRFARLAWRRLAGTDRALLALALILAALGFAAPERLIGIAFSSHTGKSILFASLLGALSPFCSCGVIPVIAALLGMGVPLAPVMAFWVASPIMSPDMYFLTAGALGFEFATAKALAAVFAGLAAGSATWLVGRRGWFAAPLRETACSACGTAALAAGPVAWRFWREAERRARFGAEAWRNTLFLGKWLVLAFVLESLMLAYMPGAALAGWVGQGDYAVPLAALVGVPAYLNGYAAVPVVAGLLQSGMSAGAALAFMLAGAITSIPAAVAVYTLVRRRVFLWYLFLAFAVSTLAGYGYAAWTLYRAAGVAGGV